MPVLPAHILNILWDDFFPRIVPMIWDGTIGLSGVAPNLRYATLRQNGTDFGTGEAAEILLDGMVQVETRCLATLNPYTQEFLTRMCLLRRYLEAIPATPPPVPTLPPSPPAPTPTPEQLAQEARLSRCSTLHPILLGASNPVTQLQRDTGPPVTLDGTPFDIRFLPGEGWDFILSDKGLEIAIPRRPPQRTGANASATATQLWHEDETEHEIYRKYTYREVGRTPIPVQHLVDRLAEFWRTSSRLSDNDALTAAMAAFGTSSNQTAGIPPRIFVTFADFWDWLEVDDALESLSPGCRQPCRDAVEEILRRIAFGTTDDGNCRLRRFDGQVPRPIGPGGYMLLQRGDRRWQLTGDIYSHIMKQLPRVAAEIWRQDMSQNTRRGPYNINARPNDASGRRAPYRPVPSSNGNSYAERYHRATRSGPGNELLDCRTLFDDRIEAWLPDDTEMMFEAVAEAAEVIITECGFIMPNVGAAPTQTDMFEEWVQGYSTNPTFTDTHPFR